jgi:hypothetical protein
MIKLAVVVVVITAFTLLLAGDVEATPLTSTTGVNLPTNHSLKEKMGCWLPFQCAIGRHRVCYWGSHCQCVPCSGWGWHLWR